MTSERTEAILRWSIRAYIVIAGAGVVYLMLRWPGL